MAQTCALIIPALNEVETIAKALNRLPRGLFTQIIVVDNGSSDGTADAARAAGAEVVIEPRRGYGQACRAGLAQLRDDITAIAIMDADLSDDPEDLARLVSTLDAGGYGMAIGSRVLGKAEAGSLAALQRFGNWLSTTLIRALWGVKFSDLGPMRVLRRDAMERLQLRDRSFGWNVEMQARAAQLRLKVIELPVRYQRRQGGRSKISGTIWGSFRAGFIILWTIFRCWTTPLSKR
jgi:glycosyltransferase involved in cell wall biosynthesis